MNLLTTHLCFHDTRTTSYMGPNWGLTNWHINIIHIVANDIYSTYFYRKKIRNILSIASSSQHVWKERYLCFLSSPHQSPEETDKEEVGISEAEEKLGPAIKSTDVYTEKHSDNLFKRTEVLAGELPAVSRKWEVGRNLKRPSWDRPHSVAKWKLAASHWPSGSNLQAFYFRMTGERVGLLSLFSVNASSLSLSQPLIRG